MSSNNNHNNKDGFYDPSSLSLDGSISEIDTMMERIETTDDEPQEPSRSLVVSISHHHLFTSAPRIINDATLLDGAKVPEKTPTMQEYEPEKYVSDMHDSPRFGHTNRIGKLVSSNPEDATDYASGLKQFTLFIIVPFIIWGIILVLFKYIYGINRIGCAAGGEAIDIKQLSKDGVSRKKRKKRIVRSWRLQSAFVITGILIPTISLIMMQSGWSNVQLAWEDVQSIVDDVETLAYRGWNILEGLQKSKQKLFANELVQDVLAKDRAGVVPFFTSWCPNAQGDERLAFLQEAMTLLEDNTETLVSLFDDYVPENVDGFIALTHATEAVDDSIEWFFNHDWIWKMYIMALNVLNVFLLLCVYIFTKHNLIHPPTRFYLAFFVVPLFTIATILLLMVTASSGIATLMNADFCAGGEGSGSPQGTIRDAIFSFQHGSVNPAPNQNLTGTLGLVYESFDYYANGCLTDPPLAFLDDYAHRVDQAANYLVELTDNLPDSPETVAMLNLECGGDVSFLPKTLKALEVELLLVQSNVHAMVEMASCYNISPLLRRLTHGSLCKESVHGLTWIWACSLTICICCFVMLSTRAALYNSVKRRKRRDKKPKRVVEKEFEEYKQFMGDYYEDAAEWKLHLEEKAEDATTTKKKTKKKKTKAMLDIDFEDDPSRILRPNPTFETANTTKQSSMDGDHYDDDDFDDEDFKNILDISHEGGILSLAADIDDENDDPSASTRGIMEFKEANTLLVATNDDGDDEEANDAESEYDSSNDSDYESDSDESEEGGSSDDESALLSFYTETRSILSETKSILSETKSIAVSVASRTLQRIRTLRPLLGKPQDEEDDDDDDDNDLLDTGISLEDNSLFLVPSPPVFTSRKAETGDGLWNFVTPPAKYSRPTRRGESPRRLGFKTPMAPQKPFSFLGRVGDAEEHELAALTTPSSNDRDEIPSGVNPRRRLKLSPFLATTTSPPDEDERPKSKSRRRPRMEASRLNLGATTPEHPITKPMTTTRARLGSDDSDDISLYVEEDAPKPPEKAYRRLARTSSEGKTKKAGTSTTTSTSHKPPAKNSKRPAQPRR